MKHLLFCILAVNTVVIHAEDQSHKYRDYEATQKASVEETYRLNHENQTIRFVTDKREKFGKLNRGQYGLWHVLEMLNKMIDESDPDTELSQLIHALQTAEAIRKDGHPRWFILTGLIHDCGKMLSLYGEPQWAVVGDTYPVGCAFSDLIIYPSLFAQNPDSHNPAYKTKNGMYQEGCGLDNLIMSWGHDEYLYQVVKNYLPQEANFIIRYHSFYPLHKQGAYTRFMNERDEQLLEWVKLFNKYDLYSKSPEAPDVEKLKPYYQELIAEFFLDTIAW